MTNYRNIALELAERCRKIGWGYKETSAGFRIDLPKGETLLIHKTPKTDSYYEGKERQLRAAGFFLIEERMEEDRKRDAARRQAEDTRKAAERAERLQRENAALLRASYAGLPYSEDEKWATTPYETMQPPKVMVIQPGWAERWLDELNDDNRPRSKSEELLLVEELKEGNWKLTHQAIAFDTRGYVHDGQTRLWAIRLSGIAAPLWVFPGMPVANFPVIDTGRKRNANNAIDKLGLRDNRPQRTAFARLLLAFRDGSIEVEHRSRYSTSMIVKLWDGSDRQALDDAFRRGVRIGKGGSGLVYSAAGAGVYLLKDSGSKDDMVEMFLEGLETGADLKKGDPRLALRNYLLRNNPTNRGQLALMMTSWNQWLKGETKQTYQWSTTFSFPRVSVAK